MRSFFLSLLLVWNSIVFVLYGLDKKRARQGAWRISEKVLLLSSFFFGGIGGYLAGKLYHHKTRKWYFQLTWYLALLVDALLIYIIWRKLK